MDKEAIKAAQFLVKYCNSFNEDCDGCVFNRFGCGIFDSNPQMWDLPDTNESEEV